MSLRITRTVALALTCFATNHLHAQVPQDCAEGNGTYDGTFSGAIRYYAFTNETRKVIFIEDDAAGEFSPAAAGTEITFRDIASDGSFTATRTDTFSGNTLTFSGRYEDCTVEGTWMLTYAEGGSAGGTFSMEAEAPLEVVAVDALCGALGGGGALFAMLAGLVTMSIRQRRRHQSVG